MCLGKVSLDPALSTVTSTAMLVSSLVIEALPVSVLERRKHQCSNQGSVSVSVSVSVLERRKHQCSNQGAGLFGATREQNNLTLPNIVNSRLLLGDL